MSEGLNKVMLLGNLGAEPELRYTQGGQAVLNMRIATTESYLDKDKVRQERTDWHSVVVWGKRGEALSKILHKGSSVFIEGSLRSSSYDDRDGNKRYKTEIVATNVLLTGGKRGQGEGDQGHEEHGAGAEQPRGGQGQRREGGYGRASNGNGGGGQRSGGTGGGGRQQAAPPPADDDYAGGGGGGEDNDIPF